MSDTTARFVSRRPNLGPTARTRNASKQNDLALLLLLEPPSANFGKWGALSENVPRSEMVDRMLKISTDKSGEAVKLVLEGSLRGPWVAEVESIWQQTTNRKSRRVVVDLSGVTFVSDEGKRLLEQICASGAEIVSSDLLTKGLADELSQKHREAGKR